MFFLLYRDFLSFSFVLLRENRFLEIMHDVTGLRMLCWLSPSELKKFRFHGEDHEILDVPFAMFYDILAFIKMSIECAKKSFDYRQRLLSAA
jgi:hypothetical protein